MTAYTHLHERQTGTERPLTSVNASLMTDVLIGTRVLGQPGNWSAQMSVGHDLTIHPDSVETLRRLAAAAAQLADDWEQVLADDGTGSAEADR